MDHTSLNAKVGLRVRAFAPLAGRGGKVTVIDAFHGTGEVWTEVARMLPTIRFDVTGIDLVPRHEGTVAGDNLDVLPRLLQSRPDVDVVDLDAYGWPHRQLEVVCSHAWVKPTVFVTRPLQRKAATPAGVTAAGGWTRWITDHGYRTVRRRAAGKMVYEHLEPLEVQ